MHKNYILQNHNTRMEEQRIVINQKIMTGKPIIRGTRIPVDLIVKLIAQGATINEINEDYPNLTKEDILEIKKI